MGDPDVRCGHMLNFPLHPDDWEMQTDDIRKDISGNFEGRIRADRKRLKEQQRDWRRYEDPFRFRRS